MIEMENISIHKHCNIYMDFMVYGSLLNKNCIFDNNEHKNILQFLCNMTCYITIWMGVWGGNFDSILVCKKKTFHSNNQTRKYRKIKEKKSKQIHFIGMSIKRELASIIYQKRWWWSDKNGSLFISLTVFDFIILPEGNGKFSSVKSIWMLSII